MNWVLLTAVAMQLTNTTFAELSANTTTAGFRMGAISSEDEVSSYVQIPYSIDTAEIQGAYTISSLLGTVPTNSSSTVPIESQANGFNMTYYTLETVDEEPLAFDVYIPGIKENADFSAKNTVIAATRFHPRLARWPLKEKLELYQQVDKDPNFGNIVQRVRDAKGLRNSDLKTWGQIDQLVQRVAEAYLLKRGFIEEPGGGSISPEDTPKLESARQNVWFSNVLVPPSRDDSRIMISSYELHVPHAFAYRVKGSVGKTTLLGSS